MTLKTFIINIFLLLNFLSFGQTFENIFGGLPENLIRISSFLEQYDYNMQILVDEIRDSVELYPYLSDNKKVQYRKIDSLTDLYFYAAQKDKELRLELYFEDSLNFAVVKSKKRLTIIDRFYQYTDYNFVLKNNQKIKKIESIQKSKIEAEIKHTYNLKNDHIKTEIKNEEVNFFEIPKEKLLKIFDKYYFQ